MNNLDLSLREQEYYLNIEYGFFTKNITAIKTSDPYDIINNLYGLNTNDLSINLLQLNFGSQSQTNSYYFIKIKFRSKTVETLYILQDKIYVDMF
jgi:hypothetical protein